MSIATTAPTAARPQPDAARAPQPAAPGGPRLSTWEFAGLMVTYWCNARCAFCYVYSGPDRGGRMTTDDALALWRGLDRLAARDGKKMRIHLAGGEPMGDWPALVSLVRAARDAGLTPLEKVETNAFWAIDDGATRARLELLDALGMEKLVISADVYHQEFIAPERVERCARIARQVLGAGRVRVRWWDFLAQPRDGRRATPAERDAAYRAALERHQDRLTGRAAQRLTRFYELHPPEHFAGQNCVKEVLDSRHVHIDPFGHVFPGVCAGIILGTARGAGGVERVWDELAANWRAHPVVDAVATGGSFELMRRAERLGFAPRAEGYANKCHLCCDVRQYMSDRGLWREHVGPPECYANARDLREADARDPRDASASDVRDAAAPPAAALPLLTRRDA